MGWGPGGGGGGGGGEHNIEASKGTISFSTELLYGCMHDV